MRTTAWILFVTFITVATEWNVSLSTVAGETSDHSAQTTRRSQDLDKVQRVLEAKMVRNRLDDLGLSVEDTAARINALTDEQLHQLATQLDGLLSGGIDREVGIILTVLLVILVAVIIVVFM